MKRLLNLHLLQACILTFCSATLHSYDMIAKKVQAALFNPLAADDPTHYAETHGIRMKDEMVRVVLTVNEKFSKENISQYELDEYKKKGDLIFACITVDNLRRQPKENSVAFIELPSVFDAT